jgi:hypothetical protein
LLKAIIIAASVAADGVYPTTLLPAANCKERKSPNHQDRTEYTGGPTVDLYSCSPSAGSATAKAKRTTEEEKQNPLLV